MSYFCKGKYLTTHFTEEVHILYHLANIITLQQYLSHINNTLKQVCMFISILCQSIKT